MASGAPARGTEINQLQFMNSATSTRTLFLDPGSCQFLIRLKYGKTFSYTNIEQNAVRALPNCLSYLLLFYLAVVLPFRRYLIYQIHPERSTFRPELVFWMRHSPVSSSQLAARMKMQTNRYIEQSIGLAHWRQIAQGFIRYSLNEEILDDPSEDDGDLGSNEGLGASQMHHSQRTGLLVYGRHSQQLANLTSTVQSRYIAFSQRWHAFIGLGVDFTQFGDIYPTIPLPISEGGRREGGGEREGYTRGKLVFMIF